MSLRRCGRGGKTSTPTGRQNLSDSTTDEESTEFDNKIKSRNMATYQNHPRGGKWQTEKTSREPTVNVESLSPDERKSYEEWMEMIRMTNEEIETTAKVLQDCSQLKTQLMETQDAGQILEQKSEMTTDTENTAKNNAEPPTKKRKRKKKKQNKAKNIEDTQIMITESTSSSPIDAATSLPLPDATVNSYIAPPIEDAIEDGALPTSSETVQTVTHIKVLARGLPEGFPTDNIYLDLDKKGIKSQKVIQFKRKVGEAHRLLPLFLIILIESENNRQIYSITSICDVPVKIERFRKGNSPTQCFKCQNFGHTQRNCCSPHRCVKCAAGHRSYLRHKDINIPPKCCNCGEAHTANYTGCSFRPRGHRVTPAIVPTSKAGKAHRLVSILKELQELLKDREVFQLLQTIMSTSEQCLPLTCFHST
nr:uncharacterized protein LOC122271289 [Parasteatoda tepidariorum]